VISFNILKEVWDNAKLPSSELFLLLTIAEHADDEKAKAWPSRKRLAKRTRQDVTTVRRQLRRLELLGFIKTERGKAPGGGNLYTLLFPWRRYAQDEKKGRGILPPPAHLSRRRNAPSGGGQDAPRTCHRSCYKDPRG
jgi:hypothetical protein